MALSGDFLDHVLRDADQNRITLFRAGRQMTIEERFRAKVDRSRGGCWNWLASLSRDGYGYFKFNGTMGYAHRFSWLLADGGIPNGMHVLHACDNRKCVNPSHLFLGTNADNVADRVAKNRSSRQRGEQHGRAKLSNSDIRAILSRLSRGEYQKDIAADYGVTQPCIGYIARGETWRAV